MSPPPWNGWGSFPIIVKPHRNETPDRQPTGSCFLPAWSKQKMVRPTTRILEVDR